MNAKDIYNYLATKYTNHYFHTAEEFEVEINNMKYPCILVMPIITKQINIKADRFKLTETSVILYLDKMDIDFSTSAVYDLVSTAEKDIMSKLSIYIDRIERVENVSELCKFSDNLYTAGLAIDFFNNPVC